MSWTYFTSYLDGTRPITKNERDELYDAFEERMAAVAWAVGATGYYLGASFSVPSDARSCGLITDLVQRTNHATSAVTSVRLLNAIVELSTVFRITDPVDVEDSDFIFVDTGDYTDPDCVLQRAANALGYSSDQLDAIMANLDEPQLDLAISWNLARTALTLMNIVPLQILSVANYDRRVQLNATYNTSPPPTWLDIPSWADIKAAFFAASYSTGYGGSSTEVEAQLAMSGSDAIQRTIHGTTSETQINIPNLTCFTTGSWMLYGSFYGYVMHSPLGPMNVTIGSSVGGALTFNLSGSSAFRDLFTQSDHGTGSRTLQLFANANSETPQLDNLQPDEATGGNRYVVGIFSRPAALPNWAHI